MPRPITLNLPDDLYESLARMAGVAELPVDELAALWIAQQIKSIDEDPLLKLSGGITLEPGTPPLINEDGVLLFDPLPDLVEADRGDRGV